jgi:hypothetical protein
VEKAKKNAPAHDILMRSVVTLTGAKGKATNEVDRDGNRMKKSWLGCSLSFEYLSSFNVQLTVDRFDFLNPPLLIS